MAVPNEPPPNTTTLRGEGIESRSALVRCAAAHVVMCSHAPFTKHQERYQKKSVSHVSRLRCTRTELALALGALRHVLILLLRPVELDSESLDKRQHLRQSGLQTRNARLGVRGCTRRCGHVT